MAGISLTQLISHPSVGDGFRQWEKVAGVLEEKRMPPAAMPQPTESERLQAVSWIRSELSDYAKKHDGEPGRVTVRRLTSGEYDYVIKDLTGYDLDTGIDSSSDSVGGEGFTNFGDVQFMQDANMERYLEAAKLIANHAVIGSGPLQFFSDPGKTGFELSAISRIKDIYLNAGIRTVSGEGGRPFGLERYGHAFYAAWRYEHRAELGKPALDLKTIAAQEGVNARFADHVWRELHKQNLGFPVSEVASRWRNLPSPKNAKEAEVKAECEKIQTFLVTWPSWLFARGDVAAGGAGDESPLQFNDRSLKVDAAHHFNFATGFRGRGAPAPKGPTKIFINVTAVNPAPDAKPYIIWHNPTVTFRKPPPPGTPAPTANQLALGRRQLPAGPKELLRTVVSPETAKKLNFGVGPDGAAIDPNDFAAPGTVSFEVPMPEGVMAMQFQVDAQVGPDRDNVYRIVFSDREDGSVRGIPTRALLGDPESAGYKRFRAGVMELAANLPPNTHSEPTPADKDPIPLPFDSAFNVPEHDEFDNRVKYVRDDRFVYDNMLDDATRARLDQAWNDLYASFEYHDNYLQMLAQHYKYDLKGKHIGDIDKAQFAAMPTEMQTYVAPLLSPYRKAMAAQTASNAGQVEDCLRFAARAWRRPLTPAEKLNLRAFYDRTLKAEGGHHQAVRALLARILIAPAFLYRVELAADASAPRPLSSWEAASRLSFFLWSSIPDDELLRAAGAGELNNSPLLRKQVSRMLADPKARRLSTEFFGQWLGFYHFDESKGVDTGRFPEFTNEVKSAMYDEATSLFEYVIRNNRPVRDVLFANYTFLNQPLAKHYGVKAKVDSKDKVELVQGAGEFQRGGVLRLGAVLTATSAPLRTSPVKRGDWVLRRLLGTPTPPPPANAGSIPADDKLFGGLSVHEKLEAHKRNATCATCHTRIDPLGFPMEHYDSVGRWRDKYSDGKPIDDSGVLLDKTKLDGVEGLLSYLHTKENQVVRTLSFKLVGYALGRTVQPSDEVLIDRMTAAGGSATFAQLAMEIVSSKQFRLRQGREETPPALSSLRNTTIKTTEKASLR